MLSPLNYSFVQFKPIYWQRNFLQIKGVAVETLPNFVRTLNYTRNPRNRQKKSPHLVPLPPFMLQNLERPKSVPEFRYQTKNLAKNVILKKLLQKKTYNLTMVLRKLLSTNSKFSFCQSEKMTINWNDHVTKRLIAANSAEKWLDKDVRSILQCRG